MKNITILGIYFIVMIGGQIYLSKRKNKYLGLILPTVTILYSVINSMEVYRFYLIDNSAIIALSEGLITFIYLNIITIILIFIYFAFIKNKKDDKEIKKMRIQDL